MAKESAGSGNHRQARLGPGPTWLLGDARASLPPWPHLQGVTGPLKMRVRTSACLALHSLHTLARVLCSQHGLVLPPEVSSLAESLATSIWRAPARHQAVPQVPTEHSILSTTREWTGQGERLKMGRSPHPPASHPCIQHSAASPLQPGANLRACLVPKRGLPAWDEGGPPGAAPPIRARRPAPQSNLSQSGTLSDVGEE